MRETVTPAVLQKTVWAGANLRSFTQASTALKMLAGIKLSSKQVRRITGQVGQDRLAERQQQVAAFRNKPLMKRLASPARTRPADLGVVMLDGGRYQRRDHFQEDGYSGSHWKEDKVGLVLHMTSEVHDSDPQPEFPAWLATADVVREIAALGAIDPENSRDSVSESDPLVDLEEGSSDDEQQSSGWSEFAPQLLSREVLASSECGDEFGHHLEHAAWRGGVVDAARTAFVADGASVNWTIHSTHFSQMTGILDLMHALSYAWKAAKVWNDSAAYERWATWIWQGRVEEVVAELQVRLGDEPLIDEDRREPAQRAVTYYTHHQHRMNYPVYRQQGLPLTSSHMESTIKQINLRLKGSEKFFRKDSGDALLQLRADSLSDSQPLQSFWGRWLSRQSGANTYRKQPA